MKMRFHGDMLLTTPVISTLKQNYPDAKIDVLLYQNTIPILSEFKNRKISECLEIIDDIVKLFEESFLVIHIVTNSIDDAYKLFT
ncbi:lipopolysaccharide core heptosyltransferase RfaQ, partial [Salmonella enterica subsp. enterica serovar Cerro]|nr:lipopolysaccharide core heptosyltransferase RfaQ [Salmonella enterica subsp. enterica serovar Cerro]